MFQHAVILAAGRGNRMRPLTDVIPKALAPFRGSTLIENSILNFRNSAIKIHVTVGHLANVLASTLFRTNHVSSLLNTSGHDNAWWISNSILRYINEPIIVLTCDNVTSLDLNFIETQYKDRGSPACMLVPVSPIPMVEGDHIFSSENGAITQISRQEKSNLFASGIQVLNPAKTNSLVGDKENFYEVWQQLIFRDELFASEVYTKPWFSIDTLEQLMMDYD